MSITILNYIIWLLAQPIVQEGLLTLFFIIPIIWYKYKASKNKGFNQLVDIAIDVCQDLVESKLSNDNKKMNAISNVYNSLPTNLKKKVNKEVLEEAVETAYQEYVKIKKQ